MRLSEPQKRLLRSLRAMNRTPLAVRGNELRTARSLERLGYVKVVTTFGGSFETERGVGNVAIAGSNWEGHGAKLTQLGIDLWHRLLNDTA